MVAPSRSSQVGEGRRLLGDEEDSGEKEGEGGEGGTSGGSSQGVFSQAGFGGGRNNWLDERVSLCWMRQSSDNDWNGGAIFSTPNKDPTQGVLAGDPVFRKDTAGKVTMMHENPCNFKAMHNNVAYSDTCNAISQNEKRECTGDYNINSMNVGTCSTWKTGFDAACKMEEKMKTSWGNLFTNAEWHDIEESNEPEMDTESAKEVSQDADKAEADCKQARGVSGHSKAQAQATAGTNGVTTANQLYTDGIAAINTQLHASQRNRVSAKAGTCQTIDQKIASEKVDKDGLY